MELSSIAYQHRDFQTDQLYRPLRQAIENYSSEKMQTLQQMQQSKGSSNIFTSKVRRSTQSSTRIGSHKIIESTFLPLNMHLVQTNNPLKRIKARSRSYRAISVDQVVGKPIRDEQFRKNVKLNPTRTKQIIYDYQPNAYQSERMMAHPLVGGIARGPVQTRTRSLTDMGLVHDYLAGRVQRVDSLTTQATKRTPTSATSIKTIQNPEYQQSKQHVKLLKKVKKQKLPDFSSDYYQNCSKYIFSKDFKKSSQPTRPTKLSKAPSPQASRRSSRSGSNYKYNLFSILDEQTNENCTTGFCTKNELVASKIKKRW